MKFFVFFLCCFAIMQAVPFITVRAEEPQNYGSNDITRLNFPENEKVGFAFYTLIAQDPPYESWIMNTPEYIKMMPDDRIYYTDSERNRLKNGMANFNIKRDLIRVRLLANLQLRGNEEDPDGMILDIIVPEFSDGMAFFPFQLGKIWIAVIPEGIDQSISYPIALSELPKLEKELGLKDLGRKNVIVEITLLPVSADDKNPMMLDNKKMSLMLSDIAALYLLDDKNKIPVWGYAAPWYNSSVREQITDLYKN